MLVKPLVRPIVRAIAGNPTASLGSGFSPTSLFLDGSKGVLYDNNDLSSFYLDSVGMFQATVNGLVGLQLDKSQGGVPRRNLLTYSEQLDNAQWTKTAGVTVTANAGNSPIGDLTAERVVYDGSGSAGTSNVQNAAAYAPGSNQTLTASIWLKSNTGLDQTLRLKNTHGGVLDNFSSNLTITTSWQRFSFTVTNGAGVGTSQLLGLIPSTGNAAFDVLAWGAQMEVASVASEYQKIIAGANGDWAPGNHRYQTTTGSKPVLRGTPVGSSLVTNGDFASGTGWTVGAGWAITGGQLVATAATGIVSRTVTLTGGRVYRLTIGTNTAALQLRFVGGTGQSITFASGTPRVTYFTYTAGAGDTFEIVANGTTTGVVDNVEIHDVSAGSVTAPYGLQYDGVDDFLQTAAVDFATATSDGLARRNLLTFPSAFNESAWPKTSISVSANVTGAPDGTLNADKLVEAVSGATTHSIGQGFSFVNGVTYTFSAYIKKAERDWAAIQFNSAPFVDGNARTLYVDSNTGTLGTIPAGATATVLDAGNGWWRFSLTTTATQSATGAVSIYTASGNNGASYVGDGTSGLFVWGAQLETGSTASAFQNIGTDKMFVCAGVRKLSSSAAAILAEFSSNAGTNSGAFAVLAPASANNIQFVSRGTATNSVLASGQVPPLTAVVTGLSEILSDVCVIRINGVQVQSSGLDQGTGNYGNYAMYFGRRNGTSLPYNGLDFGFVICGKTLTSTQIANTERWMSYRTGVTL